MTCMVVMCILTFVKTHNADTQKKAIILTDVQVLKKSILGIYISLEQLLNCLF